MSQGNPWDEHVINLLFLFIFHLFPGTNFELVGEGPKNIVVYGLYIGEPDRDVIGFDIRIFNIFWVRQTAIFLIFKSVLSYGKPIVVPVKITA